MRSHVIASAALAAALIAGPAIAESARINEAGEAKIATALAGRTPGAPVHCIYQRDIRSSQIIDRTAILYELNNGTIYLNRPSGAEFLESNDALVTRSYSDELCNVDIVRLLDTTTRFEMGSVGLGDFIPYPKPPKDN